MQQDSPISTKQRIDKLMLEQLQETEHDPTLQPLLVLSGTSDVKNLPATPKLSLFPVQSRVFQRSAASNIYVFTPGALFNDVQSLELKLGSQWFPLPPAASSHKKRSFFVSFKTSPLPVPVDEVDSFLVPLPSGETDRLYLIQARILFKDGIRDPVKRLFFYSKTQKTIGHLDVSRGGDYGVSYTFRYSRNPPPVVNAEGSSFNLPSPFSDVGSLPVSSSPIDFATILTETASGPARDRKRTRHNDQKDSQSSSWQEELSDASFLNCHEYGRTNPPTDHFVVSPLGFSNFDPILAPQSADNVLFGGRNLALPFSSVVGNHVDDFLAPSRQPDLEATRTNPPPDPLGVSSPLQLPSLDPTLASGSRLTAASYSDDSVLFGEANLGLSFPSVVGNHVDFPVSRSTRYFFKNLNFASCSSLPQAWPEETLQLFLRVPNVYGYTVHCDERPGNYCDCLTISANDDVTVLCVALEKLYCRITSGRSGSDDSYQCYVQVQSGSNGTSRIAFEVCHQNPPPASPLPSMNTAMPMRLDQDSNPDSDGLSSSERGTSHSGQSIGSLSNISPSGGEVSGSGEGCDLDCSSSRQESFCSSPRSPVSASSSRSSTPSGDLDAFVPVLGSPLSDHGTHFEPTPTSACKMFVPSSLTSVDTLFTTPFSVGNQESPQLTPTSEPTAQPPNLYRFKRGGCLGLRVLCLLLLLPVLLLSFSNLRCLSVPSSPNLRAHILPHSVILDMGTAPRSPPKALHSSCVFMDALERINSEPNVSCLYESHSSLFTQSSTSNNCQVKCTPSRGCELVFSPDSPSDSVASCNSLFVSDSIPKPLENISPCIGGELVAQNLRQAVKAVAKITANADSGDLFLLCPPPFRFAEEQNLTAVFTSGALSISGAAAFTQLPSSVLFILNATTSTLASRLSVPVVAGEGNIAVLAPGLNVTLTPAPSLVSVAISQADEVLQFIAKPSVIRSAFCLVNFTGLADEAIFIVGSPGPKLFPFTPFPSVNVCSTLPDVRFVSGQLICVNRSHDGEPIQLMDIFATSGPATLNLSGPIYFLEGHSAPPGLLVTALIESNLELIVNFSTSGGSPPSETCVCPVLGANVPATRSRMVPQFSENVYLEILPSANISLTKPFFLLDGSGHSYTITGGVLPFPTLTPSPGSISVASTTTNFTLNFPDCAPLLGSLSIFDDLWAIVDTDDEEDPVKQNAAGEGSFPLRDHVVTLRTPIWTHSTLASEEGPDLRLFFVADDWPNSLELFDDHSWYSIHFFSFEGRARAVPFASDCSGARYPSGDAISPLSYFRRCDLCNFRIDHDDPRARVNPLCLWPSERFFLLFTENWTHTSNSSFVVTSAVPVTITFSTCSVADGQPSPPSSDPNHCRPLAGSSPNFYLPRVWDILQNSSRDDLGLQKNLQFILSPVTSNFSVN